MKIRPLAFGGVLLALFLLLAPATAQDASLIWTLPGFSGGTVQAEALEEHLITLEIAEDIPNVTATCRNVETGEEGSVSLTPVTRQTSPNGYTLQVDMAQEWLGLPYPVNPWALESKPLAIISERARRSPYNMTSAEIRAEFAWVSAYMLQTAHHAYGLPLGDGLLECNFQAGNVTSAPLIIQFGRGQPSGVFERDFSLPAMTDWTTWVIDETFTAEPPSAPDDYQAELNILLDLQTSRTPAQIALIRKWDNGSAVSPWIEIALSSVIEYHVNPPRASRAYALVSVAMYDALVAAAQLVAPEGYVPPCQLDRSLTPIAPCESSHYLSEHALVAGAASTVLLYLFPDQADHWTALADEALQTRLWAGANYPSDLEASFRLGQQVGERVIDRARNDGSDAAFTGEAPQGDAYWIPDIPAFAGPQEPMAGTWEAWNLTSGDRFRPPPPPQYGTPEFEAEMREVYEIGGSLTLEQQQMASFWEDKLGTATPPGHWNIIALRLVREAGLSSGDAARVFATLGTAQADAFITTWDTKYTYWSIRPVTAIRRLIDPNWRPYIYTPGFPSYISGHATTSGAACTVLAAFFPEHADQLMAWGEEAALSRLYGGIHYRADNEVGFEVGQQVGAEALARIGLR